MKRGLVVVGALLSAGLGLLYGCVGDAPSNPDGGPGIDANAEAAPPPPPDGSAMDAPPPPMDAGSDVGPCMPSASLSGALTTGCTAAPGTNTNPLPTGTFLLTFVTAGGSFPGCASASVAGGLTVSTMANNVTIDRTLQTAASDGGTMSLLERWTGTFDAVNGKATMTRLCPPPVGDAGVGEVWDLATTFSIVDGGAPRLRLRDPNFKVNYKDASPGAPIMVFTKQ